MQWKAKGVAAEAPLALLGVKIAGTAFWEY